MDSTGSKASRESNEGFSSEEDGDCDVFLSDSDSDRVSKDVTPCRARPMGLPLRDQSAFVGMGTTSASKVPSPGPRAFIPHPMSASHHKKPLENIYFASAPVWPCPSLPGSASLGRAWKLSLDGVSQYPQRFLSRGLKRRREWDVSKQQGTDLSEKMPRVKTRGDLLFAQKCKELQVFIRPLTILLDGLKTGRYNKGLTSFQQSVAMDRIQRIIGVLQKPGMGERYLGTLLQVEMMLKVWFPHVTMATPGTEGSGPTGSGCNARKQFRTGSSETSSSWESLSPSSSRRQSFSDSGPQDQAGTSSSSGSWEERPELQEGPAEGVACYGNPGGLSDRSQTLQCLTLVMQDSPELHSSTRSGTLWPVQGAWASTVRTPACQRRPGRSSSAPPCLPANHSSATSLPLVLSCDSIMLLDLSEAYVRWSQK
ncbi:circadian-associated transcriptional repressor-like isoform X1 [Hemiscyllium ocellatum]|uniref:circadian-associated transcriptional repressor-like isoform X1 n=1 Tax=Hemiscyllium ocellatum TaxID=170820 RepID=UPI0029676DA0|nr:circadian-associated transcriptional repressor-like isoform X1 [Hemiscyllium ocellatum]